MYLNAGEANKTNNHTFPFHDFGKQVISSRFKALSDIFTSCPGLLLTNKLSSTGAYAWIKCSAGLMAIGSCEQVLERVNLYGIPGSVFGGGDNCKCSNYNDVQYVTPLSKVHSHSVPGN